MLSTGFSIGNERGWTKITPRRIFNPRDSFFEQLYRRSFIATSSVVIKKSVLDKVGGFDSSLLVAEDLDLWLRVALSNTKYNYIREHLLFYRSHEASITANPLNAHRDIEKVFFKYRSNAGMECDDCSHPLSPKKVLVSFLASHESFPHSHKIAFRLS